MGSPIWSSWGMRAESIFGLGRIWPNGLLCRIDTRRGSRPCGLVRHARWIRRASEIGILCVWRRSNVVSIDVWWKVSSGRWSRWRHLEGDKFHLLVWNPCISMGINLSHTCFWKKKKDTWKGGITGGAASAERGMDRNDAGTDAGRLMWKLPADESACCANALDVVEGPLLEGGSRYDHEGSDSTAENTLDVWTVNNVREELRMNRKSVLQVWRNSQEEQS